MISHNLHNEKEMSNEEIQARDKYIKFQPHLNIPWYSYDFPAFPAIVATLQAGNQKNVSLKLTQQNRNKIVSSKKFWTLQNKIFAHIPNTYREKEFTMKSLFVDILEQKMSARCFKMRQATFSFARITSTNHGDVVVALW